MSTVKPTLAVVPGAWHSPSHYQDLIDILEKAGYPTASMRAPSVGSADPKNQSAERDAAAIREELLLPLLDSGKDVVVVMHSYGGCIGSAAAKGLGVRERTSGGRVVGLIFVAAMLAHPGKKLIGSEDPIPWLACDEEAGTMEVTTPIDLFYHDVEPEKAAEAVRELRLHAASSLSGSVGPPTAWQDNAFDGRRGYVCALQDRAFPYSVQRTVIEATGVDFTVKELDCGHSPSLSHPQQLADVVVEMASTFASVRH